VEFIEFIVPDFKKMNLFKWICFAEVVLIHPQSMKYLGIRVKS